MSETSSKLLEVGVALRGGDHEFSALSALLESTSEIATKITLDDRSDWLSHRLDEARRCKIIDDIVNIYMQDPTATLVPAAQNPADEKNGLRDFSPNTVRRRHCDGFRFAQDILRPAFENRWQAHDAQPGATPSGS